MNETKPITSVLMRHKEGWIDKLRNKRVRAVKIIKRGKRLIFESGQKNVFKRTEGST